MPEAQDFGYLIARITGRSNEVANNCAAEFSLGAGFATPGPARAEAACLALQLHSLGAFPMLLERLV